ncbi:acetylcholinesterase collagenic tail peptide-like [Notothenia coriiceps]|uniref:Acetylcholinesterase collagenic tail peptide-like n=1 Tax=Notothenia coriiceps TaxID=8208 RepID=A0A6I9PVB7_9TELE|nr:PREDICTED: acetylcholinesterase collagenic tail peptide-like [Notothenia coriiceps]
MDLIKLAVSLHYLLCSAWARHSYMDSILSPRSVLSFLDEPLTFDPCCLMSPPPPPLFPPPPQLWKHGSPGGVSVLEPSVFGGEVKEKEKPVTPGCSAGPPGPLGPQGPEGQGGLPGIRGPRGEKGEIGRPGSKVREHPQRASRVLLDIEAGAPVILIPESSCSPRVIVANLGQLRVQNSFLPAGAHGTFSLRDKVEKLTMAHAFFPSLNNWHPSPAGTEN